MRDMTELSIEGIYYTHVMAILTIQADRDRLLCLENKVLMSKMPQK